jgi:hypothetical protein
MRRRRGKTSARSPNASYQQAEDRDQRRAVAIETVESMPIAASGDTGCEIVARARLEKTGFHTGRLRVAMPAIWMIFRWSRKAWRFVRSAHE